MKPLQSSLTFLLPSKCPLFKTTSSTFPPRLPSLQLLTYPDFKHYPFLVHPREPPQQQGMTEAAKCGFLKPLPSDHPKPSELTYMFICSFDSSTSEKYLGGWKELSSFSCTPSLLGCSLCALQWFLAKNMKVFSTLLHRTEVMPAKNHNLGGVPITHF